MKTAKALSLIAYLFLSANASADDQYSIEIARQQVDMNCVITKANGGSTDCTIKMKEQGKQVISMEQDETSGGFTGTDQISETAGTYVLAVSADETKKLNAVTMMRLQVAA